MPEGDTVHLAASKLDRALGGHKLTKSDVRVPRYALTDLSGSLVKEVVARGKHLMIRVEGDTTLHTHFGMDGSWWIGRLGAGWGGPVHQTRVILEAGDVVARGFSLASVDVVDTSTEDALVGHLGPDLLGPDWDARAARANIESHPARAIADVLLDQTVLAGIGNVFACEICFLRGLHPMTPVAGVSEVDRLVSLAKRLLEANRGLGRQVTTGDLRRGRGRWVYGRHEQPCLRCGERILKEGPSRARARVTYWCPRCQPAYTGRAFQNVPAAGGRDDGGADVRAGA